MSDSVLFKDTLLGFNKKPVKECEVAIECNSGKYRLYVDKDVKRNNFQCVALEFVSCTSNSNMWECEDLMVNPLFNLTAYFDGVRHLEFNRESKDLCGYMNYPNIDGIIHLMQKVREIEKEICYDCE